MLTATRGRAIMHHNLLKYEPVRGDPPKRTAGVMIATDAGTVTAYSLDRLYDRGTFFVKPGDAIYEGQVVGEHCKEGDVTVNLTTNKKLTNVRASGSDDATQVKPAREFSLEACWSTSPTTSWSRSRPRRCGCESGCSRKPTAAATAGRPRRRRGGSGSGG